MKRRTLLGVIGSGAAAGGGGIAYRSGALSGDGGPGNSSADPPASQCDCDALQSELSDLEAQVATLQDERNTLQNEKSALQSEVDRLTEDTETLQHDLDAARSERDGFATAHDEGYGQMAVNLYNRGVTSMDVASNAETAMKEAMDNGNWDVAAEKAEEAMQYYYRANTSFFGVGIVLDNADGNLLTTDVLTVDEANNIVLGKAIIASMTAAELMEYYVPDAHRSVDPRELIEEAEERLGGTFEFTSLREDREQAPPLPTVEEFETALWVGE